MSAAPRCLIVGADGLLGGALLDRLRRTGVEALGASRRRPPTAGSISLDLASDPQTWNLPAETNVVVNCAAEARVAACRRAPTESRRVNVDAVVAMAQRCADESRRFIHLSSDRVFSGRSPRTGADAAFAPTSEYGRQKAEADRRLLDIFSRRGRAAIVRFAKVVGRRQPPFSEWRNALGRGEPIHPFADMTVAPVSLEFATDVLCRVILDDAREVFQTSAESDVSYAEFAADFAADFAAACGAPRELIEPVSIASRDDLEPPPAYTSLDVSRIRQEMKLTPPTPKEVAQWLAGPAPVNFPALVASPETREIVR